MTLRIAYLGPAGTFTEQATRAWAQSQRAQQIDQRQAGELGDWEAESIRSAQLAPAPTVPAAIDALRAGEVEAAVVPFENSVEGSVPATLSALIEGEEDSIRIRAEVNVEIQFSALVRSGTGLEDIRTIATHPHAAAQTREWLARTLPRARLVAESSTARAAQAVAEGTYDAAIAAPGAAQAYGLVPVAEQIADRVGAVTRFVVLDTDRQVPGPTGSDRTTLVAHIWQNHPGALLELLEQFAVRGIDLSRLESRPTGEGLGEYCFWIDANGHLFEPRMAEALIGLRRTCREVRFLGSYPRADGQTSLVPRHADEGSYGQARQWLDSLTGECG